MPFGLPLSHWDLLRETLPADPRLVTGEHMEAIADALAGHVAELRDLRARIVELEDDDLAAYRELRRREDAHELGYSRVRAWAAEVGAHRFPELPGLLARPVDGPHEDAA